MVTTLHEEQQTGRVTLLVNHNGEMERMTYQEVFVAGHRLWLAHDYEKARKVFAAISGIHSRGPKAHILWAHCCAMQGAYSECSRILSEGLPSDRYGNAAIDLHDTFVMWKCGLWLDVRKGLEKVISEHLDLPTPCLILGELLMEMGNLVRPPELLQQAKERDIPGGAVAIIATQTLVRAKQLEATLPQTKRRTRSKTSNASHAVAGGASIPSDHKR